MPVIQSTFPDRMSAYALGRRVNMEEWNSITGVNSVAIGIAQPAFQGATDQGIIAGGAFAATSVGAAVAGNTGAATITAAPTVAAGAKAGVYKLTAVSAGATAVFLMTDPDAIELGEATTGSAATIGGIGPFTITDAGTDPAIGDQFTITVTYTANDDFLGITEWTPDADADGLFAIGSNVPVCESGVIAVMAGGTCTRRTPVYWIAATKTYTSTPGTNYRIRNAEFDASASSGSLVPVRLRRIPPAA
jgi:hypothetical protein